MPQPPAGPSGDATWTATPTDPRGGGALLLPDAHPGPPERHYALAPAPRLVRSPGGAAAISLTLSLDRPPDPGGGLEPHVEQGDLALDVHIGAERRWLDAHAARTGSEIVPLFARSVHYRLHDGDPDAPWAEASASGTTARAALTARLGRDASLTVLAVLSGATDEGGPLVRADVEYRTAGALGTLRYGGRWSALYDLLVAHASDVGEVTSDAFAAAVARAMADGVLRVTDDRDADAPLPYDEVLVPPLLRAAAVMLERDPLEADRYRLRGRPHEAFVLDLVDRRARSALARTTLEATLAALVRGGPDEPPLDDRPLEAYVRLVAHHAPLGVPRRVRAAVRQERSLTGAGERLGVAALGGSVRAAGSVTLPLVEATRVSRPTSLVRPSVLAPAATVPAFVLHGDYVLATPGREGPRNLPVVTDGAEPLWPDRTDARLRWYAPVFELVLPDPAARGAPGPFRFAYRRTGATDAGESALVADVHFTLTRRMSAAGEAAARAAGGRVREVPLDDLRVAFELPFVDRSTGRATSTLFECDASLDGDLVRASLTLQNDWVRLCYGALSVAGFQATPARLRVGFAFTAAYRLERTNLDFLYGGKVVRTPIAFGGEPPPPDEPYFDATDLTLRGSGLELRLTREQAAARADGPRGAFGARPATLASRPMAAPAALVPRPVANAAAAPLRVIARPPLKVAPALEALLAEVEYATRTTSRVQSVDALVPCAIHGASYVEDLDGPGGASSVAIGCRDALALGQTRHVLYEELADLGRDEGRLYRSLSQPGHFVVVPTRYRITRLRDGDGARPGVLLYAVIDAEDASNLRLTLEATLQPDLEPHVRRELLARLAAFASEPRVHLPTEVTLASLTVDWGLGNGVEAVTLPHGPFVRTTFATGAVDWLLLRARLETTGLVGTATFALPDGTRWTSGLELALDGLAGPWDVGAVEARVVGAHVELRNLTQSTAEVHELALYGPSGRVPVEASLPPDARLDVALDAPASEALPVFTIAKGDPVAIAEVRSFIESIRQHVAFVTTIDFAGRGLEALEIEARLIDVDGTYAARLTATMPVADIEMVLPLTTYLDAPTLAYRVAKQMVGGPSTTTAWLELPLADSAIVPVTWERLT